MFVTDNYFSMLTAFDILLLLPMDTGYNKHGQNNSCTWKVESIAASSKRNEVILIVHFSSRLSSLCGIQLQAQSHRSHFLKFWMCCFPVFYHEPTLLVKNWKRMFEKRVKKSTASSATITSSRAKATHDYCTHYTTKEALPA